MLPKSIKSALVIAGLMTATAIPGYSDAQLAFSNVGLNSAGGTIQLNTSTNTLLDLNNIIFNQLIISGTGTQNDGTWSIGAAAGTGELNYNINSTGFDVFEIGVKFLSCSGCNASLGGTSLTAGPNAGVFSDLLNAIYTFSNAGSLPSYSTTSGMKITMGSLGAPTSLPGIDNSFLADLGLPLSDGYITGGTINTATGPTVNGSISTWTASSETLNVKLVATPEPASILSMAGGFLLIALAMRKRLQQA